MLNGISWEAYCVEMEKISKVSSYPQDFLAGADPVGLWTAEYGQEAERAKVSPATHGAKAGLGVLGGILGGAVVLPTLVSGVAGAATGATRGQLVSSIARGFLAGAKKPIQQLVNGKRALNALIDAAASKEAKKLSGQEIKAIQFMIDDAAAPLKGAFKTTVPEVMHPAWAKNAIPIVADGYKNGLLSLAAGGAMGGGGALIQYQRGRNVEKKFQKRLRESM